jgi:hypothetical protein
VNARVGRWVFAGTALVYLSILPPGFVVVDENSMFAVADALAGHRSFQIACRAGGAAVGTHGRGGACYSKWYPLLSIVAAPFVALGRLLGHLLGLSPLYASRVTVLLVPALLGAGAAAVTAGLAKRLGASRAGAVGAACAVALGTELLVYSRTFFAETLAAFLVALGVWGVTGEGGARRVGYAAFGLAVLAKPQMALVGPVVGATLSLVHRRWKPVLWSSVSAGLGLLDYLGYNLLRFGSALTFGPTARFSLLDLPRNLALLLISPGRGLIFFSPVVVLGLWLMWRKRAEPVGAACLAGAAAILLVYGSKARLGGGFDWGTRLLVPTLPLLCAVLGTARRRQVKAAVALVAIGFLIQAPAIIGFYQRYYEEQRLAGVRIKPLAWSITGTPLVGAWTSAAHTLQDTTHSDVSTLIEQAGQPTASIQQSQLLRAPALWWWWLLPGVGLPTWVGGICAALIAAAGMILLRRAAFPHGARGP